MIDIKLLRENPDLFKKATADKQRDPQLAEQACQADKKKLELLQKVEALRSERNKLGKADITRGRELKEELKKLENELKTNGEVLEKILWQLPNPAHKDTPVGKDESENVEVRKWGKLPEFDFPVKDHCELGSLLEIIDTERAGKVSGARFGYLKNEGARLELALVNFGLSKLIEKGFSPVIPPVLIKKEIMAALGYNNYGFEETYVLPEDGLCLVATAEHALVPMFKDEILSAGDLPKRLVGFSSCFRREAGSYGKDTRGILRVHQFNKLEMVSFVKPEDAEKEHQFLLTVEEELMQALGLPYRVVQMCTGDLGDPAAAKFDIETWFPSEGKYRETHSVSNCTDYQSRRLNTKLKRKDGKTEFLYILNGTAFSERPILAILENFQQKDGSVLIPEVLQPYTGFAKISPKK